MGAVGTQKGDGGTPSSALGRQLLAGGWYQVVPSGKKPPALHVAWVVRHGSILDMAADQELRLY